MLTVKQVELPRPKKRGIELKCSCAWHEREKIMRSVKEQLVTSGFLFDCVLKADLANLIAYKIKTCPSDPVENGLNKWVK